jgi:hypothetical protein
MWEAAARMTNMTTAPTIRPVKARSRSGEAAITVNTSVK